MSSATGMTFGYARVSMLDQDEALQRDALAAAGADKMFVDKASGSLAHRPALDELMRLLRPGDTVVVWRLDRLGRSLRTWSSWSATSNNAE
jgi:serine recombinase